MSSCSYFKGKTVIITGASSGIGQGTAVEFARLGANLVLGGRNVDQLKETKNQCCKAGLQEKQVVWVAGDIAEEGVQKQLVDAAMNTFNQIDILVNNAGILNSMPVLNFKMEEFDKIHNVNLRAAISLTLMALPQLIKTKGNIINISSIGAWMPITGNMAYAVSKAGMDMFTKSLAFEVAPQGVRVNSVNPGVIPTNINRDRVSAEQMEPRYKMLAKMHPVGRVGEIKEVVDSIIFFASDKSSFITGQLMAVGGGCQLGGVSF